MPDENLFFHNVSFNYHRMVYFFESGKRGRAVLMASDVVFADQHCYLNDINRHHAVCYGLFNAKKVFEKTLLFQYQSQLRQEAECVRIALAAGKRITDPDFPQFPYQMAIFQERLVDCFLIGTFFEIVAKAFLLDKGFIVHKLDESSQDPNIKQLVKQQRTNPVATADLLQHDHFQDYKQNGRNGLKSLKLKTIDYGWLYKNGYERELGFDEQFCRLGRYFRIERNMIHFPLAGASESQIDNPEAENTRDFDSIAVISDFIESQLTQLFEKRKQEHNFSNLEL